MQKHFWIGTATLALMLIAFTLYPVPPVAPGEPSNRDVGFGAADTEAIPAVERLLIPVMSIGVPGRFDSQWVGSLLVRNSADVPVFFASEQAVSSLPGGGLVRIQPGVTVPVFGSGVRKGMGEIFAVESKYAAQVHLSHRIADESRRPISHGTEIPIVREADWLSGPVELLDIPTDFSVRRTLRVYDPTGSNLTSVRVAIFPIVGNQLAAETTLEPRNGIPMRESPDWFSGRPSYAEIPDLIEAFPQLAMHERLRIRIEPLTPGMRYWAFVTITDNLTQHVTVVTPQ